MPQSATEFTLAGDLETFLVVLGGAGETPGRRSSNPKEEIEYLGTSALNLKIFLLGLEETEEGDDEYPTLPDHDLSGVAGGTIPRSGPNMTLRRIAA